MLWSNTGYSDCSKYLGLRFSPLLSITPPHTELVIWAPLYEGCWGNWATGAFLPNRPHGQLFISKKISLDFI